MMLQQRSFVVFLALFLVSSIKTRIYSKSIINNNDDDSGSMELNTIKWVDDQAVLELYKPLLNNSSQQQQQNLIVIDTRSSNEYNGWKSFEKFDYNSDDLNAFNGHFKDAYNFEIEWLFNFNESLITQIFEERIGLKAAVYTDNNQTMNNLNDSYEIMVYDTKLERLEAMRDYLLNKYKISKLYLYKIIDKKVLYEVMLIQNMTYLMEHEPAYDIVVSPEFLYSIIFNPLASTGTRNGTLVTETGDSLIVSSLPGYKLLDVSYGDENQYYMASHIPTSIHLDTNEVEEGPIWNRRNRTQLINLLADLGIKENNTDLIILYGNPDPMASYRVAVIFKWLGVNNVHILNGGYQAWLRRNFPIEKKFNKRVPVEKTAEYEAYFNNVIDTVKVNYIVDEDFVADLVKNFHTFSDLYSLVDIRSWREFVGETSGYVDLNATGRIPDAIWGKAGSSAIELEDYRNPDLTMRSANDIRKMWYELGIDYQDKHLIFYCGTGWRAAEVLLYAEVMGLKKISLYDGGWYEWSANVNNTIETGPPVFTTDIIDGQTTTVIDSVTSIGGTNEQETTKTDEKNSTNKVNAFSLIMIILNLFIGLLLIVKL